MELEEFNDIADIPEEDMEEIEDEIRPVLMDLKTLKKYTVPKYPLFIGRERRSSICIPLPAVSRRHAKVFERDKKIFIQDMGSINGTFINGKRILDPVELKSGDRVQVGITKKYPKGAKEFLFKVIVPEKVKLEKQKKLEREKILKEIGVKSHSASAKEKILLKHCIFKVTKLNLMTVFKSTSWKRVPLASLNIDGKNLSFHDLIPFKIKDNILFSIEHPNLPEPPKFSLKIEDVKQISQHNIFEHKCSIVKILDKHKAIFTTLLKCSDLICYVNSRIKTID